MKRFSIADTAKDVAFALMFISNWFGGKRLVDITDGEFKAVYSKFFSKKEGQKQEGRSD